MKPLHSLNIDPVALGTALCLAVQQLFLTSAFDSIEGIA